jgi:hypothetical protein
MLATPATAQQLAPEQRVEYNKLLQQRNRLVVQLRQLDEKASTLIKSGKDATVVHADQVSTQDQLDLVELRLAIFATRNGLPVPPPPGARPASEGGAQDGAAGGRYGQAFARGRDRAVEQMRLDALKFLSSLDFKAFLKTR